MYRLPTPRPLTQILPQQTSFNAEEHRAVAFKNRQSFNTKQQESYKFVINSIYHNSAYNLFYLDGPGGSGKTYLYNTLIHEILGRGGQVIACASTGIASTLLLQGNTYHSSFKLFPPIMEGTVCQIKQNSMHAKNIINAKLILIDEITMATNIALDAIDKCCQDLIGNTIPFGGKTVLIGGDFRQCLPVVRRGSKAKF